MTMCSQLLTIIATVHVQFWNKILRACSCSNSSYSYSCIQPKFSNGPGAHVVPVGVWEVTVCMHVDNVRLAIS